MDFIQKLHERHERLKDYVHNGSDIRYHRGVATLWALSTSVSRLWVATTSCNGQSVGRINQLVLEASC